MRMTDTEALAWVLRVLRTSVGYGLNDTIWWRTDGEYAPVTILVNCNDLFWWATADAEHLHPGDVEAFEASLEDAISVGSTAEMGAQLWCARKRGMRPQAPYYRGMTPELAALFDAAGPAREDADGRRAEAR